MSEDLRMSLKEEEFLKRLQAAFKVEAGERLSAISSGLLKLEKMPPAEEVKNLVESVFRDAHSLKGAARAVNLIDIESVCQSLENVFASLKREEISLSAKLFDTFYHAIDTVQDLLSASEGKNPGSDRSHIDELVRQIDSLKTGGIERTLQINLIPSEIIERESIPLQQPPPMNRYVEKSRHEEEDSPEINTQPPILNTSYPVSEAHQHVKVSVSKLDSLFHQAEEMLSIKLMTSQRLMDLQKVLGLLDQWSKEWAKIDPDLQSVRRLSEKKDKSDKLLPMNGKTNRLIHFFDWNHAQIRSLESELKTILRTAQQDYRSLSGMVDHLLEEMKKVLMLPFSSLLEGFPRLVRDLARGQGKGVDLVFRGSEIEMDRRILEEMKDPLIHLLRNCVDHGIEKPQERVRNGKPPRGIITVAISRIHGNKVEILVTDDGCGINMVKVKDEAVKRRIVTREEGDKLSEYESLSLIFVSGFSSSPIITTISGRGLGLAIVREKIEKLNGLISVETEPRVGTSFKILLPVTLATFRGVLVRVSDHTCVIPTINVERAIRVKREAIQTVENKETVLINGQAVSLVRLDRVLELPEKKNTEKHEIIHALVLGVAEKRIAFIVDAILNEREVLVKDLGKQLLRVRNIAGATVLGSGEIVPILNVPDLMKSAAKSIPASTASVSVTTAGAEESSKGSILVVEDSFTSRMLLKNILESAGYRVQTAVDGMDGLTTLKTNKFDLVISDVEMPRMGGFDLTAKIRSDSKLSELPVVLLTGLESREDRERGIDVGANAYLVKSNFEQSNLLETIRRLIL